MPKNEIYLDKCLHTPLNYLDIAILEIKIYNT